LSTALKLLRYRGELNCCSELADEWLIYYLKLTCSFFEQHVADAYHLYEATDAHCEIIRHS